MTAAIRHGDRNQAMTSHGGARPAHQEYGVAGDHDGVRHRREVHEPQDAVDDDEAERHQRTGAAEAEDVDQELDPRKSRSASEIERAPRSRVAAISAAGPWRRSCRAASAQARSATEKPGGVLLDQNDDREAERFSSGDHLEDRVDDNGRKAERRLVEQEQLGTGHQRGRSPASAARRPTGPGRLARTFAQPREIGSSILFAGRLDLHGSAAMDIARPV